MRGAVAFFQLRLHATLHDARTVTVSRTYWQVVLIRKPAFTLWDGQLPHFGCIFYVSHRNSNVFMFTFVRWYDIRCHSIVVWYISLSVDIYLNINSCYRCVYRLIHRLKYGTPMVEKMYQAIYNIPQSKQIIL